MAISNSQILITHAPLLSPPNEWGNTAGAVVDFWGIVRGLEDGREISGIEYEAHDEMAQHQMEILANEARGKFPLDEIFLHHRIGVIRAGEASLFLRCSSPHRTAAFGGSEWIIAELKKRVPIWKRPLFVRQEEAASRATGR